LLCQASAFVTGLPSGPASTSGSVSATTAPSSLLGGSATAASARPSKLVKARVKAAVVARIGESPVFGLAASSSRPGREITAHRGWKPASEGVAPARRLETSGLNAAFLGIRRPIGRLTAGLRLAGVTRRQPKSSIFKAFTSRPGLARHLLRIVMAASSRSA